MNNLKEIRTKKGMSQRVLADMTGSSKSYISRLELNEIRDPSLGKSRLIAMALRCDVEVIFPKKELKQ